MRYEFLVGLRYARAERTNHFVSFLSLVSMAGIALGVAALIVVLAVVNGFEREFRRGVLAGTPHVELTGSGGRLADWPAVATIAAATPGVRAVAPFAMAQGLLALDDKVRGVVLRGILPDAEDRAAGLGAQLRDGRLDGLVPGENAVILGTELARALGVKVGERVALLSPEGLAAANTPTPQMIPLRVAGLFSVGFYDFDISLAIMHLADVQALQRLGDDVSGLRVQLHEPLDARRIAFDLSRAMRDLSATDWTRGNQHLFHAVHTSRLMVVLVVSLLIAIATFNIVASLVMAVVDKQADIAVLRTLGASPGGVMRVFMVQGTVVGVMGTAIGVAIGVVLALNVPRLAGWVEAITGFQPINAEIYHISQLPSDLHAIDVVFTAVVALVLALLATLYPSWRAARSRPAEALRYE